MNDDLALVASRVGAALRELRRAQGLSQERLAERVGIAPNYVCYLERGDRTPSLEMLSRLARVLGVDIAVLLSEVAAPTSDEELVLQLYRRLSDEMKPRVTSMLLALGEHEPKSRAVWVVAKEAKRKKKTKKLLRATVPKAKTMLKKWGTPPGS